jgi:serine/threonine-protein kinase RIO1
MSEETRNDPATTTTENPETQTQQHQPEKNTSTATTVTATDDDTKVASVTIASTAVKRPAWGSVSSTTANDVPSSATLKKKTFAEIMAEEHQDKEAAHAALFGDGHAMSLVAMQAEQERLFLAAKQQQHGSSSSSGDIVEGLDPEELRMIELALKESLKDNGDNTSNECSSSSPTTRGGDSIGRWSSGGVSSTTTTTTTTPTCSNAEQQFIEKTRRECDRVGRPEITTPQSVAEEKTRRSSSSSPSSSPRNNNKNQGRETAPVERGLSAEELAAIEAALKEADAMEEAESLRMALLIQQEEIKTAKQRNEEQRLKQIQQQSGLGNIRTMTRAELAAESERLHHHAGYPSSSSSGVGYTLNGDVVNLEYDEDEMEETSGFRMNSSTPQQWNRVDRNTIVGPNNEIRTKHDVRLQGQTNAELLALDTDGCGVRAHVGNQAFNAFRKTMKRTTKGVARDGTGRAGSDTDATRGKALDKHVRLVISKAINSELIDRCNGAVKQGKEAVVYYAVGGCGPASGGFDVAVKVFKRIQEFRGRGSYVDGDPRYVGRQFKNCTEREQLEIWTEKEYRNLVRAHRAKVPVPTPLDYKQNVLFMRFMGNDGWPAPQIREIDMRKGSTKWVVLYNQVMESVRRLYVKGRLVHGDLSEYNILIAPVFQVENYISSDDGEETPSYELQTVLIDFGQAIDSRHPQAEELLERDLRRVNEFFDKQGITTMSVEDAMEFVTTSNSVDDEDNYDDDDDDTAQDYSNGLEKIDETNSQAEAVSAGSAT